MSDNLKQCLVHFPPEYISPSLLLSLSSSPDSKFSGCHFISSSAQVCIQFYMKFKMCHHSSKDIFCGFYKCVHPLPWISSARSSLNRQYWFTKPWRLLTFLKRDSHCTRYFTKWQEPLCTNMKAVPFKWSTFLREMVGYMSVRVYQVKWEAFWVIPVVFFGRKRNKLNSKIDCHHPKLNLKSTKELI